MKYLIQTDKNILVLFYTKIWFRKYCLYCRFPIKFSDKSEAAYFVSAPPCEWQNKNSSHQLLDRLQSTQMLYSQPNNGVFISIGSNTRERNVRMIAVSILCPVSFGLSDKLRMTFKTMVVPSNWRNRTITTESSENRTKTAYRIL